MLTVEEATQDGHGYDDGDAGCEEEEGRAARMQTTSKLYLQRR
jgi:hypothetical protein